MKIDTPFLIDTNILVYYFDEDSEFYQYSRDVIDSNPETIYIASKSISEFVCVMSKKRFYNIIENELVNISSNFNVIFPDTLSTEIFSSLVLKHKPSGNRAYDYEIASVMLANGINKLVTINVADFKDLKEIEIITK
jgi:predicted nucleic acid-binding protein